MTKKTLITPKLKDSYKALGYRLFWSSSRRLWGMVELDKWTGILWAKAEYFTDVEYAVAAFKEYLIATATTQPNNERLA